MFIGILFKQVFNPHSPQRTSASGPYAAAGRGAGQWCRGSCSQTSYRAGVGKWDRYEYRTWVGGERQTHTGQLVVRGILAGMFKCVFYSG